MQSAEHSELPSAGIYKQYRYSWIAYLQPLLLLMICVGGLAGLQHYELSKNPTVGIAGVSILMGVAGIYRILILRSVKLFTNDDGVWMYRGLLPWHKGVIGVKWRDLDEALYYTGFFSWLTNSHTVRINHRFTKDHEILLRNIWNGDAAVNHINSLHKQKLSLLSGGVGRE